MAKNASAASFTGDGWGATDAQTPPKKLCVCVCVFFLGGGHHEIHFAQEVKNGVQTVYAELSVTDASSCVRDETES